MSLLEPKKYGAIIDEADDLAINPRHVVTIARVGATIHILQVEGGADEVDFRSEAYAVEFYNAVVHGE